MSERITAAGAAKLRAAATVCELCGEGFTAIDPPVLDHDHGTGVVRGVLHRGCNSMLGVIENGRARYRLRDIVRLTRFLAHVVEYIYRKRDAAPLYPTHRTADEKRLLRNKRARLARKALK